MKAIFEKEYDLRPSDFNCYNKLLPGAVLDIFQDVAGRHSVLIGADIYTLSEKGLIWVVAKTRFEILGDAKMYQTVKVKTWPLKPSKISFRREYLISDLEGNIIIKGSSEWLVVDKVRRHIMPSKGIYSLTENEHSEELVFKDKITKIHSFDPTDDGYELVPRFTDIDINGHVNNIKYANFVIDAMDGSENNLNYTYFQIDYHKEVLKDTALRIYLNKSDDEITALGKSNNELMFSCLLR